MQNPGNLLNGVPDPILRPVYVLHLALQHSHESHVYRRHSLDYLPYAVQETILRSKYIMS